MLEAGVCEGREREGSPAVSAPPPEGEREPSFAVRCAPSPPACSLWRGGEGRGEVPAVAALYRESAQ